MQRAGKLIEKARSRAGLTQPEVAEKANVSDRQLRTWEKGDIPQQWESLASLCRALNIDANTLLDVGNSKSPDPEIGELLSTFERLDDGDQWMLMQFIKILEGRSSRSQQARKLIGELAEIVNSEQKRQRV